MNEVRKNINLQERKDAYVVKRILNRIFEGKVNLKKVIYKEMPEFTHYDLDVELIGVHKTLKLAFEIKERNKAEWMQKKWPTSEMKVSKYNLLKESTKDFDHVFFIQLINEDFAYIYNMRKLDWSKIQTYEWHIRTTQYDENSKEKDILTHFIPYSQACMRVDNLAEIYADYYYNNPQDKRYADNK